MTIYLLGKPCNYVFIQKRGAPNKTMVARGEAGVCNPQRVVEPFYRSLKVQLGRRHAHDLFDLLREIAVSPLPLSLLLLLLLSFRIIIIIIIIIATIIIIIITTRVIIS